MVSGMTTLLIGSRFFVGHSPWQGGAIFPMAASSYKSSTASSASALLGLLI